MLDSRPPTALSTISMQDPTEAPQELLLFSRRLSERLRELRFEQNRLPREAHQFAGWALRELEETSEELAVTTEQLRLQNDELALERAALRAEKLRFGQVLDLAPDALIV